MFEIQHDAETYCWLKYRLEPRFRVIAEPAAGYFEESAYHYRIFDGTELVEELWGDFQNLPAGTLAAQARDIVRRLSTCGTAGTSC